MDASGIGAAGSSLPAFCLSFDTADGAADPHRIPSVPLDHTASARRPPRAEGRGPRLALTYGLAALLLLGGLAGTFLVVADRGRRAAVAEAERMTQAVASGLADQATRALQAVDLLLADIAARRRADAAAPLPPELLPLAAEFSQLRDIVVLDAAGIVVQSTATPLLGRSFAAAVDVAGMQAGRDWARLGRPIAGRAPDPARDAAPRDIAAAGVWSIPLTRAVRTADGEVAGAVVALLNPDHLTGIAARPAEAFGVEVRFLGFGGVLLAQARKDMPEGGGGAAGIGASRAQTWLFRQFLPRRESGSFTGRDADGRQITASLAVTRGVPLVVEVAQAEAEVLAGARRQETLLGAAMALLAAGALATLVLLLRTQRRLEASAAQARAATRAKDEFLAAMSHEIRTPMNGVIGTAELLLDTRLSPMQRRYAETMQSSAAHLLSVLNGILDFSKLEAGDVTLAEAAFSVEEEVTTIAELFAARAAEKNLELVCAFTAGVPARLVGDAARLRQILFNLVGNAVKFTEGGWVRLAVACTPRGGGRATFTATVSDTGIGFDPARLPQMFEPFAQGDASIERRFGGTGLGLSISRRLASAMQGEITAEPRPGGGSVFRVSIEVGLPEDEPPAIAPGGLAGRRVLVLAPEGPGREALAAQLAQLGIRQVVAGDLAEARAALREGRFDAALVEAGLPDAPRAEAAAEALREAAGEAAPRLVLLTAGNLAFGAPRGLFHAVLLKPVLPARLVEALTYGLRAQARAPDETPPAAEPAPALRVLVVEDNPVNQFVLRRMLERAGVGSDIAPDGEAALRACAEQPYDMILMDVQMPVLDGLEATRRLRAAEGPNRRTRVIGLTAAVGVEYERRCIEAGMDDYLSKPIQRATLMQALGLPV